MGLSFEAIKNILDIKDNIVMSEEEMAHNLKIAFYPKISKETPSEIIDFSEKLKKTFIEIGVDVVPYESVLESISFKRMVKMIFMSFGMTLKNLFSGKFEFFKFDFGKKVKKGVSLIMIGEGETGDLPVDHVLSLRENPMILICKAPLGITKKSSLQDHISASLPIFSWNLVNLIISVGDENWTVYSYNMSYPTYDKKGDFKKDVLHGLVPKIYAPVIPPRMSDFEVRNGAFDTANPVYEPFIKDLVLSGKMFAKTRLYPEPRKISDLKFRNSFYRWLGSLLLDKRNGMSYGFLARQLPVELSLAKEITGFPDKDFFFKDDKLNVVLNFKNKKYSIEVPEVWILTSRSGSDKTNLDLKRDIVKMGLVNGKMIIETPKGVPVGPDYKPSFDTKVIFSHSVANAIFASLMKSLGVKSDFPKNLETNGRALAHWHGYFNKSLISSGWYFYGTENPTVSCSAPQGAVYAFLGKEKMFTDVALGSKKYEADVHVEPQHGSNVSYSSLQELSEFILKNKNITSLGNEYLDTCI